MVKSVRVRAPRTVVRTRPVPPATILGWILTVVVLGGFSWLAIMLVTIGPAATNATVARMIAAPFMGGGRVVMPLRNDLVNPAPITVIPAQPVVMNTATGEERVVMV